MNKHINSPDIKVVMFDTHPFEKAAFESVSRNFGCTIDYLETRLTSSTVALTKGYDGVCCFVNDKLDSDTVCQLACNHVQFIALRCAGFNNVDLREAQRHELPVFRVPAYSPYAIAEHAMALTLSLNRKVHHAYLRIKEQNFSLNGLVGFDLHRKTIGVIGTGKIGKVFSKIATGFGTRVLVHDIKPDLALVKDISCRYVDLDFLLRESDVISLHLPLTPDTHHLIDEAALSKMKSDALVINTGRGALIDSKALIAALKSSSIGGAGLDVYEEEEGVFFEDLSSRVIKDDVLARLMTFPNVLITSHQGFLTKEALDNIANTTLKNIEDFIVGGHCDNVIIADEVLRSAEIGCSKHE